MRKLFFVLLSVLSGPAFANVVGTHLQNFNPTTNGLDFVTVQSSKTIPVNQFNFGLYFDYAKNSLPFFKAPLIPSTQNFDEPSDTITTAHFNLGFGIMDNWEVGLTLPMVIQQAIDNSAQLGSYDDKGLTEFRLNTKYRAWTQENMGLAFVGTVNFDRINNNPFTGGDAGPTWNLEAVYDYQISANLLWAFNLGYRFADPGDTILDTGVTPIGDALVYSTALAYKYFPWDATFIFEIFGSDFTDQVAIPVDRKLSNLEAIAGVRKNVWDRISAVGGIGTGLTDGFASPDFRLFIGANWLIGPVSEAAPALPVMVKTPVVETTYEEVPSETIVLNSINFEVNKDRMTPKSRTSMNAPIAQIKKNLATVRLIIVEGHTDHTGTAAYNQTLSEKRAKAVREVLLKELNLADNQIQAQGFGKTRPLDSNETETGRTKNRRVELKIYRTK